MAMPRKDSRKIVVDAEVYRWHLRSRPTYDQGLGAPLTVAIQSETQGRLLTVVFGGSRPDNWVGERFVVVKPAQIATAIQTATTAGWDPNSTGVPQYFEVESRRLFASEIEYGKNRIRSYDPTWLADLAQSYTKEFPWLATALKACTQAWGNELYLNFLPRPYTHLRCLRLHSEEFGALILDIDDGHRVAGVEFLDRL